MIIFLIRQLLDLKCIECDDIPQMSGMSVLWQVNLMVIIMVVTMIVVVVMMMMMTTMMMTTMMMMIP